jgi:RHS repeat-associated protein
MQYEIGTIGSTTVITDARGDVRQNESDTLGRQVAVREYTGTNGLTLYATTSYAYNVLDKQTQVTVSSPFSNNSSTTSYSYDSLGRKVGMSDPDMGGPSSSWTYVYNPSGTLLQQTDAKGVNAYFSYDHLDRITQKSYSAGGINANYYYDQGTGNLGQRTQMVRQSNPTISTTWVYDSRGRVQETDYYANNHGPYGYRYTYDSDNRVTQLVLPSGGPETLYYGYDGARRPTSLCYNITGGSSGCYITYANTTYTALDQPQTLSYGNGIQQTWDYYSTTMPERLQRLRIGVTGGNLSTVFDRNYTYDYVGNLNILTNNLLTNTSETYSYDPLNRLSSWQLSNAPLENYYYDPFGNLTGKAGTAYTYAGTGCTGTHQLCQAGSQQYTYDNNGNQTPGGSTYNWDAENQPLNITSGSANESYSYDADGERASRTVYGVPTITTIYLGPLFEMDVDSNNVVWDRRTMYKFGSMIVAERDTASNSVTYLHPNHQRSITAATTSSGSVAGQQEFKPWGEVRTGSISQTSLNYSGQRLDSGTGLLYDHARYYNAAISHFNSADTVIPGTGSQDVNRYSYVTNNPVNLTDPTGHNACIESIGCGGPGDGGGYTNPRGSGCPGLCSPPPQACIPGQGFICPSPAPPTSIPIQGPPNSNCPPMNSCPNSPVNPPSPTCSLRADAGPNGGGQIKVHMILRCPGITLYSGLYYQYIIENSNLSYDASYYFRSPEPDKSDWLPEGSNSHQAGHEWNDWSTVEWTSYYSYYSNHYHEIDIDFSADVAGSAGGFRWYLSGSATIGPVWW